MISCQICEDDGVHPNPPNPGMDVDSSNSDGVHTDPDKPASGNSSGSYPPTGGDEGGYTPPTTTDPDIESTEDDGVHSKPSNPGTDVDSSTSDGVHTDPENPGGDADSSSSSTTTVGTTKPIYPSVYIIEPSANYTVWVKKGEPVSVSISALGQDCVNMTAYINGELAGASNDNYLSCSYPITKSGQYHISVVGTSKTGHTSTSVRTVTVNDTYTVAYSLNGGEGVTPETQTVNVGEGMTLAIMAHPKDCYKLDHTFDGWCISPTGSDNLFIQGEETEFSTNVTLYAQFTYVVD